MSENQNTPGLRFEGFADPWKLIKLGELFQALPFKPFLKEPEEYGKYEVIQQGNKPIIGFANGNPCTEYKDTVLFGDHTLSLYKPQKPFFVATDGVRILKGKQNIDGYYLLSLLERHKPQSEGYKRYYNILVNVECFTTYDVHEQEQIGSYLDNLNYFITLQQKKCERLQHLKQALLRKMFPKPGEQVPELRFEGFTEPWKERKLGELSDEFEYGLNVPATAFDGNHKYLRITDIDNETHRFDMSNLTSPLADFEQCEQYRLREHDLLFARTGASVGKTYLYRPSDGLTYYAGFLIRAHIHDDVSSNFVFQSTLTERYQQFVTVTSQRSGQPGINAQEYSEFVIPVPSVSEQHAIGSFFSHMDSLITLYQRNYERLQHLKQALLQRMFV